MHPSRVIHLRAFLLFLFPSLPIRALTSSVIHLRAFLLFLFFSILILVLPPALPPAPAQSLDSLKLLINNSKPDTHRVSLYLKLFSKYINLGVYDTALIIADTALHISEKLKFKKGIAASYNNIGLIYFAQGDYGKCLDFHLKSLKIKEEIGDKKGIAVSQNNLAELHFLLSRYHDALVYNQEALQLSIELGAKEIIKTSYQTQSRLDSVFSVTRQRRATGATGVTGKSSYEHFVLARQYHDSLFSEENEKGIAKAETRYELYTVEKQQNEEERRMSLARGERLKKRNNIQYAGISVGIVVMFLVGWRLRKKKKRMSNDELRMMNDEVNVNPSTFQPFNSSTFQHLLSTFNLQLFTLMVLFQFILLLMGPYVDAVSGGIPFYKVGINIGISLLIFPVYNWLGKRLGVGSRESAVGSQQSAVGSAINPKHNLFFFLFFSTSILVLPLLSSFVSPQTSVTTSAPPASQPNTPLLSTNKAYIQKINKYSTLTTAYSDSVAIYKNKNQWLVAREYYRKFSQWDDSLKLTKQAGELSKIEEKNRYKMEKLEAEYRAKEKAVQEAEKLQRRNLIQYSLIYLAVMALVVLVLISGKIKMDARIGNVLIFVITLLSFETLLTATDPLTDTWSGGVPLFKLCMNIVLAGLVVPLHGWMEGRLGGKKG